MADWSWKEIERQVREQITADLIALETTPLEYGQRIAWSIATRGGVTVDLSPIHRVGFPKGNMAYTTCEVPIPAPVCWLPLSPAIERTMTRCPFCEAGYMRSSSGIAA
jgi:hypothetical protein